ncbi:PLK protein kinase [Salpingoeca rosetta]|uniref:Serine/threonine-protein kinase PLK n=1 Tax=Salpingoeca rosetta (strain ATCC 50818 / BSB-021) TaxID=946362 RepID=F2UIW1_SALR5|nr:PLK protein kinase [Salpingoeca rosetta]EGD77160.1 PLK protein kinase [Salpingoeca rosetta]|eukprot:XP_004990999.1 PLK protein kinase [Salpingoeca rosetta]
MTSLRPHVPKTYAAPTSGVTKHSSRSSTIPDTIYDKHTGSKYVRGSFLGKGGFAYCYKLTDVKTKKVYAGKIVSKATLTKHRAKEKLRSEIQIHKSLRHKHVVDFHSFFEDENNVYILLELCPNQSMMELHKRRRALTEAEARYYLVQIVLATKYMHKRKVIHRDLKLGNLFLGSRMDVKVGDFGLATTVTYDGERKKTLCGTPNYIAPEILEGRQGHSFEVDVWSIGCILYTLLVGKPPFETRDIKTTYRKIRHNDYNIPAAAKVTSDAENLIRNLLHPEPTKRPSLDAILEHPFVTAHFVPATLPVSALTVRPTFSGTPAMAVHDLVDGDSHHHAHPRAQAPAAVHDTRRGASGAKATRQPLSSINNQLPGTTTTSAPMKKVAAAPVPSSSSRSKLEKLHKRLFNVTAEQAKASTSFLPAPAPSAETRRGVAVTKWVDYSFKYGLGYQLSDGTVGVFFNDHTKIALAADLKHVEFTDRDCRGGKVTCMTLDAYPDELNKKITLLKYFRDYMRENLQDGPDAMLADKRVYEPGLAVVNKWLRTKHAIVFRMNVGVVQVNFFDHSKLVVNGPRDTVTFINTEGETNTYFLDDVAKSNHPSLENLSSRLTYVSDIVDHMVSKQRSTATTSSEATA